MTSPQPGIFAEGTRSHRHLELVRRTAVESAVAASCLAQLAAQVRPATQSTSTAHTVVGVAPRLWRTLAAALAPDALAEFPVVASMPITQRDAWVWVHGGNDDDVFDAARAAAAVLAPAFEVVFEVTGFTYHDSRDLIGFVDGTENPTPDEAPEVALIADGVGAGGSFAITQRWVHHLDDFLALPVPEQELVVGRTKVDDIELDDEHMPANSHVARTALTRDGEALAIYRRSTPFGDTTEHGLHFVAFCADPTVFDVMLRSMDGTDDGVADRLMAFSTPVTGAAWFVPAVEVLTTLAG